MGDVRCLCFRDLQFRKVHLQNTHVSMQGVSKFDKKSPVGLSLLFEASVFPELRN